MFYLCNQSVMHKDQIVVTGLTLTSIMSSRKSKCSIPFCDWRFSRNQLPVKICYRISGIGTVLELANKYVCGLTLETVRELTEWLLSAAEVVQDNAFNGVPPHPPK